MEKISVKVAPSTATVAKAASGLPASRPSNSPAWASNGSRESGVVDFSEAGLFLEQLNDVGEGPDRARSEHSVDFWSSPEDATLLQDDQRSMDDVAATPVDVHADSPDPQALIQSVHGTRSFIETFAGSSATGDRQAAWDVDLSSTDQFTIDHPRWGLIEVDSRRSAASWDLTVRCADSETRQRLKDREQDFHSLLSRDYGASLSLDLQPVSSR